MSTRQMPENWGEHLFEAARGLEYPPTPAIAAAVRGRLQGHARRVPRLRPAWVIVLLLAILASLLAVPGVRAQIANFIQLGMVRIFPAPATPTPMGIPTLPGATSSPSASEASTPSLTSTVVVSLPPLAGETTLADARKRLPFPIRLPDYPPSLGLPQRVYIQAPYYTMLILVWTDPAQPQRVRMSLEEISPGNMYLDKIQPKVVQQTTVKNFPALWTEGPYLLYYDNGNATLSYLVTGHVLVWAEKDITYRLETTLSMDETVRIAESLK